MAIYCVLGSFTEQGVRNAKDSPKRAEAFKEMARKCGVTVKDVYWAQGQYDVVTILEASRACRHLAGPERRRAGQHPHPDAAVVLGGRHEGDHREDGVVALRNR